MTPHVPLDAPSAALFGATLLVALFATRTRPAFGIALMLFVDPLGPARYVGPTTLTLPKAALAGVLLGLIARRGAWRILGARDVRSLLSGAIAIVLVTIATAIPGIYIDVVARESLKAIEYLLTFAVATVAFAADPDEETLWRTLGALVVVVCAGALAQEVLGAPSAMLLFGHSVPRIAGSLEGPNQLAGFFDVAGPLVLARAVAPGGRVYAPLVALVVLTDVLTFSRAGLAALSIGLFCVAIRTSDARTRSSIALGAGASALGIGALLARYGLLARFLSTSDVDSASGLGSRGELWHAAIGFWRAHPILGIGAGNYELELPQAGLSGVRTHANSLYLQSLAEGGVLLLASVVFALGAAIRTFFVRAPRTALFIGTGAATIAFAAHQVLDDLLFFPKVGAFWWLWAGIAAGALASSRKPA